MESKSVEGPEIQYRADIDGLRAIAVLAVIGFHARPGLIPGGFIGVDVFFVISGVLISSLILNGLNEGNFSFLKFYGRRIRRLFPALSIVLLATLSLGWFIMFPTDFAALGKQTVAAAAFAANILNYAQAGYFDAPAIDKPLLHIWSLGVEEQFYFVFPALLLLAWRYKALKPTLALFGIASFALNIALVRNYQSFTFYLPFTRFWEFIAGALLARTDLLNRKAALPVLSVLSEPQYRDLCAAAGGLLIVASAAFASETSFPGWWALPPVFGSFFVIGAGPQAWLNHHVLAKPGFVFIGLISYPLYLWHWPLLVMGRTMMAAYDNRYERTTAIIAVLLAFLLSWLTFQFIERPVRARRPAPAARTITAALAVSMVSVALLGFATLEFDGLPIRYPREIRALVSPTEIYTGYVPGYNPPDPAFEASKSSASPLLIAYGDSHAWHLRPGLLRLQSERTFRLAVRSWSLECVPIVSEVTRGGEETCQAWMAAERKYFEEVKPDIVVIAAHWLRYKHLEKLSETVRFFRQIGVPRIVVIGPVPYWFQYPQVMLYRAYMRDPQHGIPERLFSFSQRPIDGHRIKEITSNPDVRYISAQDLLCSEDGCVARPVELDHRLNEISANLGVRYISAQHVLCNDDGCLARLGDTANDIVQFDKTHLTPAGSWYFISHIANQLFGSSAPTGRKDR
jgi:peptidoglycan/LPS O-acetylase OafA/YrhL